MTEFSEVMRKWTRMCEYYGDDCGDSPSRCPLADMHGTCEAIYNLQSDGVEWESIERIINEWHEPVYPTWFEWLESVGVAGRLPEDEPYYVGSWEPIYLERAAFTPKAFEPIPADIAQKLGIEPKEDV